MKKDIVYLMEHPVIKGFVPVDNLEFITKLNNMELIEGQKVNETPPVYVKSTKEEGVILLSGLTKYNE